MYMLLLPLCTSLQEVQTALGQFHHYDAIWRVDREEELQAFMKQEPRLGEFEAQIVHYEDLERQIAGEKEYYNVGPVALHSGEYYNVGPLALHSGEYYNVGPVALHSGEYYNVGPVALHSG